MPKASLTLLIVAGEPSGDRLGAALMAALKAKRKGITFIGVGGPAMEAEGLTSLFPMADLAVMGVLEIVPALPRILKRLKQLTAFAFTHRPDGIITIDNQDFSARLAARLKPLGVPHIQYVAPKMWAWRPGRAKALKTRYTRILSILPFEVPFFKAHGIPTTYVGHPATTTLAALPKHSLTSALTLALLPGSRTSELKRHWPLMLATYRILKQAHPQLSALLPVADATALATCQRLAPWHEGEALTPVIGDARFAALPTCRAALAKSGTNNLEMALLGLPAVVCYRMNALTYALAKRLVRVPFISLPNLILNTAVYPEFIQNAATPHALAQALTPLLQQKGAFATQKKLLARLQAALATPKPPADMAAEVVLELCAKTPHN